MKAQTRENRVESKASFVEALQGARQTKERFENHSGINIDPVYGPQDLEDRDLSSQLGWPGDYPFTRGIHPTTITTDQ